MHLHPTLAALIFGGVVFWTRPAACDVQRVPDRSKGYFASPDTVVDDFPCVRAKTCRVLRIRNASTCTGVKIVETIRIHGQMTELTNPDAGLECARQDHWLVREDSSPPVLLVEDCSLQAGTEPPGATATEIVGCDILFRYFELRRDSTCRIREVGIHLDTLQAYREIESDGVLTQNAGYTSNPATRRAIHLPRGRGVDGSPLIEIDGPATLDKKTSLPELAKNTPPMATSIGDPLCVGTGTCSIARTWNVPKCTGMKVVDTRSTMGPTKPDDAAECVGRSYWLVRGADSPPVLLAEDCEVQTGAASTGTSTILIEGCDALFKYTESKWDDDCIIREVGIHLSTLQPFKETEREGVLRKDVCRIRVPKQRAIRLPRGKGGADSPLIKLDGPTARESRAHERVTGNISKPANAHIAHPDGEHPLPPQSER